jgi:putative oxidoreductase
MSSCPLKAYSNSANIGKLILRLVIGGMMLPHGIAKAINGLGFIDVMLAAKGIPTFVGYGVFIGEIIAPLLIIVGFKMRPAAAVLAFQMIVIIALVHLGNVFSFGSTGGFELELQYLYLFGAVSLMFLGSGKYSIDKD